MDYREILLSEITERYLWLPSSQLYKKFEELTLSAPSLEVAKRVVEEWTGPEDGDVLEIRTIKGGDNSRLVYVVGLGILEEREGKPPALFYLSSFSHNGKKKISTVTLEEIARARIPVPSQ